MSLPHEAKRDCQGPLCMSLEHGKHSIASFMAWDSFQRRGPSHDSLVHLFLLPDVVCCPPWLWWPVLGAEAAVSPQRCPALCREHLGGWGWGGEG